MILDDGRIALGGLELVVELGLGQRVPAIGGAPDFLGLGPGGRCGTVARVHQVTHFDAQRQVLVDLAVQPAAVNAVDVREHGNRVFDFLRREHDGLVVADARHEIAARIVTHFLAEVDLQVEIDEIPLQQVAAVGRDVRDDGSLVDRVPAIDFARRHVFGFDHFEHGRDLGAHGFELRIAVLGQRRKCGDQHGSDCDVLAYGFQEVASHVGYSARGAGACYLGPLQPRPVPRRAECTRRPADVSLADGGRRAGP